jgi:hypothetical protein
MFAGTIRRVSDPSQLVRVVMDDVGRVGDDWVSRWTLDGITHVNRASHAEAEARGDLEGWRMVRDSAFLEALDLDFATLKG